MALDKDGRPIPISVPPRKLPQPTLPPASGRLELVDWMADVERQLKQMNARLLALEKRHER